jgi:hypothetical protein
MICRKPGCMCPLNDQEECCPDCLTPNPGYKRPKKKYCYSCGREYTSWSCPDCHNTNYTEKPNSQTKKRSDYNEA